MSSLPSTPSHPLPPAPPSTPTPNLDFEIELVSFFPSSPSSPASSLAHAQRESAFGAIRAWDTPSFVVERRQDWMCARAAWEGMDVGVGDRVKVLSWWMYGMADRPVLEEEEGEEEEVGEMLENLFDSEDEDEVTAVVGQQPSTFNPLATAFNPSAPAFLPASQQQEDFILHPPSWRYTNAESKAWLAYAMYIYSASPLPEYASPSAAMVALKDFKGNGSTLFNTSLAKWLQTLGVEGGLWAYEAIEEMRENQLPWNQDGGVSDMLRYPAERIVGDTNVAGLRESSVAWHSVEDVTYGREARRDVVRRFLAGELAALGEGEASWSTAGKPEEKKEEEELARRSAKPRGNGEGSWRTRN